MPKRVIVKTFKPPKEPIVITARYGIPNPERMAKITVARLQLQLLGQACQCHTVEELIGLLKDLAELSQLPTFFGFFALIFIVKPRVFIVAF